MSEMLGNLSDYMLIPDYLRKVYMELTDMYDTEWEAWFSKMMPRTASPGDGSKRYWTRDQHSDPQGMAVYIGDDEAIEPMNYPHVSPINYNTRTLGNAFTRTKKQFAGDFKNNTVTRTNAEMLENLTKFINRSIEYTLTRFVYGDLAVIQTFSTQNLNRQAVVRLDTGDFNGVDHQQLGDQAWDDFGAGTPPVFEDIAFMKKQYKHMANKNAEYFMIGRECEYVLELNDDLLDRLIRIKDTTQGVLGDYLMGLELIKVSGQTYKEVPGADGLAIGMPGAGDYIAQDWTRLNKIDMMTETLKGGIWEWGVIGSREIGEIRCGYLDDDHKAERGAPTEIFVEQFEEKRPKRVWTTAQLNLCPYIPDYSKIMLVRAIAEQVD